jgi:hypothetical protein
MTEERVYANNTGLPELLAHIDDMHSQACRLSGVLNAIAYLENESACGAGRTALVYMAEELAEQIYSGLDCINLPEVTT